MICLDLSNFDADVQSSGKGECLAAEGVTDAIVGCQRPAISRLQIRALRHAGIRVRGVYAFLYFGLDTIGQTEAAIAVAQEFGIKRVWLDVEAVEPHEKPGMTPAQRCDELRECVFLVEQAGLEAGIYTGGWYWPGKMNTTEFSHLPLWHSAYLNGDQTPYEVRTVNYGGWTDVAVHQWTSTYNVCGRKRDANHIWEEMQDGNEVTREEYENLVLAQFSGMEETYRIENGEPVEIPRAERLQNALYRLNLRAAGDEISVNEQASHRHQSIGTIYGDIATAFGQASKAVTAAGTAREVK